MVNAECSIAGVCCFIGLPGNAQSLWHQSLSIDYWCRRWWLELDGIGQHLKKTNYPPTYSLEIHAEIPQALGSLETCGGTCMLQLGAPCHNCGNVLLEVDGRWLRLKAKGAGSSQLAPWWRSFKRTGSVPMLGCHPPTWGCLITWHTYVHDVWICLIEVDIME